MIICRVCAIAKPLIEYPNHKAYANGKETRCKVCLSEYRKSKWYENLEVSRGYARVYKAKNRDLINSRNKEYVLNNQKKRKQTMQEYRKRTKPMQAEYVRRRQAALLQRTPNWLTENDVWMMQQAYELASLRTKIFGFSWHVDHIIPLQGKLVSGFHTPYNLQVIPATENIAKLNRFEVVA